MKITKHLWGDKDPYMKIIRNRDIENINKLYQRVSDIHLSTNIYLNNQFIYNKAVFMKIRVQISYRIL